MVPLAAAAWGVARRAGRRSRACRCSRGRRPSGSDSEATGRGHLPQRPAADSTLERCLTRSPPVGGPVGRTPPAGNREGTGLGARGPQAGCLGALAERPGDGVGGRGYAEFGFRVREPISDCVQAEAQLPCDVRLFFDRGGGTEHSVCAGSGRGDRARPGGSLRPPPQQQRVRITGQQVDGEAPPVPYADERRARWQREPRSDGLG